VDPGNHDFHIPVDSPCLDKGSNNAPQLPDLDFDGEPRITYEYADMGADEYFGGRVFFVPDDYTTIQAAIDICVAGDTVFVAPGTYNESIDFLGKAITVESLEGPYTTVIDGGNLPGWWLVSFVNDEGANSVLDGFTVTNHHNKGFYCGGSTPTIRNNIITHNGTPQDHGGGGIFCSWCSPIIINNIIAWNYSDDEGGGINCTMACSPTITNCTIFGNIAGESGGGISFAHGPMTNTIVWGNTAPKDPQIYSSWQEVSYCNIQGGWPGDYNIDEDPLFVDSLNQDLHLSWRSPCINRGTNAAAPCEDMDGDQRPHMGTVDMGADEFIGQHALEADLFSISETTGGQVNLSLFAGPSHIGRSYLILGSISGTAPGTYFPATAVTLPLNWDLFTGVVAAFLNTPIFSDFQNVLEPPQGTADAVFNTLGPIPGLQGLTFHFAFLLYPWDFTSNPVPVEVAP